MVGVLTRIVDAIRSPDAAPAVIATGRQFSDSVVNGMTGMGSSVDAHAYTRHFARRLTQYEIDQAYSGSQWMRKLIDLPAREQVRARRDWQADKATIAALEAEEDRLALWEKVKRAETLRGLGGAAIVIWIDGDDPTTPLDPARVKLGAIKSLSVWSRWHITLGEKIHDLSSEWHGYPSYAEINGLAMITKAFGSTATGTLKLHPSRLAWFRGEQASNLTTTYWLDEWWGVSKVEVALNAVLNCDAAQQSFASMIKDAVNVIIGIPNLTAANSLAAVEKIQTDRLTALNTARSVWRAIVKDNGKGGANAEGGETVEYRQMNWAGIPDVLMVFIYPVAASGNMPATIMLGKSPDGMNATGKGDLDTWEREIDSRREVENRPCLRAIDAALIPSALGRVDAGVWWEYGALSTPTAKEQADTAYAKAQAIQIYAINNLLPGVALAKGVQNMLVEDRLMPGLDDALSEIPEAERFPSETAGEVDANGNPIDPNATQGGGGPVSQAPGDGGGSAVTRRAANDALTILRDAGIDVSAMVELEALAGAD